MLSVVAEGDWGVSGWSVARIGMKANRNGCEGPPTGRAALHNTRSLCSMLPLNQIQLFSDLLLLIGVFRLTDH